MVSRGVGVARWGPGWRACRSRRPALAPEPPLTAHSAPPLPPTLQAAFSVLIFLLLSSQDGFQTKWKEDDKGVLRAPAIYNGAPARPARAPLDNTPPPPQFKLQAERRSLNLRVD